MIKRIIFCLGIVMILPLNALFDCRYTTLGQWEIIITNWGPFGGWYPQGLGYWPRYSGHNFIQGSGMWIGGILPTGDTAVSIAYNMSNGNSEYAPGFPRTNHDDQLWRVYYSTDDNYPFMARSMEDGYAVFNDFDPLHQFPDSFHVPKPIGIRLSQYTSVWPRGWADDLVFIKYVISNDTTYTIDSLYAGFAMDFDIGNESGSNANDFFVYDGPRKLFIGIQAASEPGWDSIGMIGLKLLSSHLISSFKRFTLNLNPRYDGQIYKSLAGYNFRTGAYEPFDTIPPPPDDQRVSMNTGPFNILPGDSLILDWVMIASHDQYPSRADMNAKADRAQRYFDLDSLHNVHVVHPVEGEIISGLYRIDYTAVPATANPLSVDIYFNSESTRDTIAYGCSPTGYFDWQTDSVRDCVLGRMGVLAFDTITFGYDRSDGYFIIDNAGNTPPYLLLFHPHDQETIAGQYAITWFARDPEFVDSLPINIYFRSQYDSMFLPLGLDLMNDSVYVWNTRAYRNGSGSLIIETHDESISVAETIQVYLYNHISGGGLEHPAGLNNALNLEVLVHQPENLTNHTYLLEFDNYRAHLNGLYYYPEYIYDLIDSNTGITIVNDYSIIGGYTYLQTKAVINEYSPIIDGFSIHAWTNSDSIVWQSQYKNDSVKVLTGIYPEDSIKTIYGSLPKCWWAYHGSRIRLDWMLKSGGGLTLQVIDLDYGDTIPCIRYNNFFNADSAFGWCFNSNIVSDSSSDTLRSNDKYILLCGNRLYFSRTILPPEPGDQWIVYPHHVHPPIKGNLYKFRPINYITENKGEMSMLSFQIYPIPVVQNLVLEYALPKTQHVKIIIYDILGRKIKELIDGKVCSGEHKITWDKTDNKNQKVAAGVYFCRLETGKTGIIKKVVLLK